MNWDNFNWIWEGNNIWSDQFKVSWKGHKIEWAEAIRRITNHQLELGSPNQAHVHHMPIVSVGDKWCIFERAGSVKVIEEIAPPIYEREQTYLHTRIH